MRTPKLRGEPAATKKKADCVAAGSFVMAIAVLLLAAGYVVHRLAGERAYREKWKDYNDCGWA